MSFLQAWEGRAYDYCMDNLRNMGYPVEGLAFDPDLVIFTFSTMLAFSLVMFSKEIIIFKIYVSFISGEGN